MLRRLSNNDLYRRLTDVAPRPLLQIAVATVLIVIAGGLRYLLDRVMPGVAPFALLFPLVLAGTLLTGWLTGFWVMLAGGIYVWIMVMEPRGRIMDRTAAEAFSLVAYFAAASVMLAFAETYRRTAAMLLRDQAALRESEARLELATEAAGVGVWEWRLATDELIYSDRAKAIWGLPLDSPMTTAMSSALMHPDDLDVTTSKVQRATDPAIRDESPIEYRIITPKGEERWILAHGRAVFEDVAGAAQAVQYVGTLQDITDRRRAEAELVQSGTRLRLAIEAGRMAIWQTHSRGVVVDNPELNSLFGLAPEATPTLADLRALCLPGEFERINAIIDEGLSRGEPYFEAEFRIRRPDGGERWALTRAEILLDATNRPHGALGVVMDITERKDSEERLKMLAREVDHRANNLLAVVQSTVQLSRADTAEALKSVLVGRIAALARAHQLLSEARWEGADLKRLVNEELLGFSLGEASRATLEGPEVALAPAAAQALAMALHELATNAAKYGALSTPAGRVDVAWTREPGGPLTIEWSEHDGPKVKPPTRRGLGTAMLSRCLRPLKGQTDLDWRAEGLTCRLEIPSAALEKATSSLD